MFSNKKRFHDFIEQLRTELNLTIYNYHMPEYEEDEPYLSFRIKEINDYLFGAWIYDKEIYSKDDGKNFYIKFFCQHIDFVDKFKPSRGCFCLEVTAEERDGKLDYWLLEIENCLNWIKKHKGTFFFCEDDIWTVKHTELYYRLKMHKEVKQEEKRKEKQRAARLEIERLSKIAATLDWISAAYRPDTLNDENKGEYKHINDTWYILPHNKIGKAIANRLKKIDKKYNYIGHLEICDNELDWRLAATETYIKDEIMKSITQEDINEELEGLTFDMIEEQNNHKLYVYDYKTDEIKFEKFIKERNN